MKKLNDANMGIFVLLSVCLCLFSCNNDNDNLPKDYAGFEHSKETVECESDKSECELKIKIVATEKTKEDRTVVLATPPPVIGQAAVVQLTEKKVIIKAGKKSATTVIKIYPKQMILKKQNVTLSCTPQWKEGGISKLTIRRNTESAHCFHAFTARAVFSNSQLPGTREKTEVIYPASDTDTYFLGSGGSSSTLPIGMDSLFIYATGHDTNGFHLGRDTHGLSS